MGYNETQALLSGRSIATYLTCAMIDNYSIGNRDLADQQAIDAIIVNAMIMALEFYEISGADTDFTQSDLNTMVSVIGQYEDALLLDLADFVINTNTNTDAIGGGGSVQVLKSGSIIPTPHAFTYVVLTDGQTTFQLPFDIANVDSDSITVVLNDADAIIGDSYSITGTTFTWTGAYPLSSGWKFEIKYWI